MKLSCEALQLPFNIAYSSQLQIPTEIKGQDRIFTIAKHFNADNYINLSGGRELYNEEDFKKHNINLHFLPEYVGSYESILSRIINEECSVIKHEISSQGLGK
jgi:hypothetical protein